VERRERPPGCLPAPSSFRAITPVERETSGTKMKIEASERLRQATAAGNAITRLHRDYYGRGATTTRTVYQRNHLVVFLEDIYTPLERTLIDAGNQLDVRRTRQVFQDAMRERFAESIEEITGRKVIQFMSQVSFDPDMAAEIFILEPGTTEDIAPEHGSDQDGKVVLSDPA
jgi:uncharacterized protein YbcI